MESQVKEILKHLKKGKSITAIKALDKFKCFRLASRILNIRDMGYNISVETVEKNGKRFAEYRLVK